VLLRLRRIEVPNKFPVAPDLIRGLAAFSQVGQRKAQPRIKSGATMLFFTALLPTAALAQQETKLPARWTKADAEYFRDNPEALPIGQFTSDITVTATSVAQLRDETGLWVTSLDRTLIEARQSASVADLLATTPGITVSRNGGPGQPTAVRIRGAEDAQTLVLIDGVRVNDPSAPAGAFDFGNLLTGNIERIEVLRGPNSVPWGSAAIGGVVNIVTDSDPGVRLRAEYGDRNAATVSGNAGFTTGPLKLSAGGGYLRDDGVSTFKFGTERDGFRQYAANARAVVTLSDAVSIDLRGNYADSRADFDGFPPPFFAFADTSGFSTTKQAFGYGAVNARVGNLDNRFAFSIADTRRASYTTATATPTRFAGRIERYEYRGDWRANDAVRAVFGIEHENSRGAGASTGMTSGYAQAIVTPVEALTLTGGIRVDDHRAYGTKATLSANAAWRIGDATIIRASYGEGFKAPTLFQLFSAFGTTTLRPETAQSFDAGIEQKLVGDRLRLGVTAFQRDVTNQIDFAFVPFRADRPFGYYANIARTRTRGIEAFIEARPDDHLTLSANYSLIDAKDRATGLALLRRPKHSVNASIDWAGPVKIGADVRLTSDSRDFDFVTFDPTNLDGYALVTLRAALPIGERFEVYGRIENLFDAAYETVSGYGTYRRNAHIGARVKF
jgi:vitamin B12 transporter